MLAGDAALHAQQPPPPTPSPARGRGAPRAARSTAPRWPASPKDTRHEPQLRALGRARRRRRRPRARRRQQQLPPRHLADAAGVRPRRGPLPLRRRRQPADRLLPRHGADDPRPQPAGGGRRRQRRSSTSGILFAGADGDRGTRPRASSARWCRAPSGCASAARAPRSCRPPSASPAPRRAARRSSSSRATTTAGSTTCLVVDAPASTRAGPTTTVRSHVAGSPGQDPLAPTGPSTCCPGTTSSCWRGACAGATSPASSWKPAMCNTERHPPGAGYLEGRARGLHETGTVLIFDEVITGFRVAPGGAQERLRRHARPRRPSARRSPTASRWRRSPAAPTSWTCSVTRQGHARRHLQRPARRHGGDRRDALRRSRTPARLRDDRRGAARG